MIILLTSGAFSENVTEYGECRKFSSESILRFDAPSPKPSVQTKVASPSTVLRPGLEVETELISLVDSEHASTGDAIEARVTRAVKDRGAVVIPAGTRVSGRIIFERRNWFPDQSFWISFRLDQIELAGQWLPVRLAPARPDNADLRLSPLEVADLKHSWSPTRSERMTLVFQNRKGVRLGKGTLWRWETR